MNLKQYIEFFDLSFANSQIIVFLFDVELNEVVKNNFNFKKSSYTKNEFDNIVIQLIKCDEFKNITNLNQQKLYCSFEKEIKIESENNKTYLFLVNINRLLVDNKEYLLFLLDNVSEKFFLENELKKSSQLIKNILDNISDAFFSLDDNLLVTYFNPAAEQFLGRKADEVLGRYLFDAFPEAKGSIFDEKYHLAVKEKIKLSFETYFDIEPYRNWYEVRVYPQPSGISVFFTLINERKQYEWELNKLNEELESKVIERTENLNTEIELRKSIESVLKERENTLIETQNIAKIGRWSLDLKTNFLEWSNYIFEMFEINPLEFKASYESFLNAIHPDDRELVNKVYLDSLKNQTHYQIEHRLLMPDGRIKWVREICHHVYDENLEPIKSIGIVQDITDSYNKDDEIIKLYRAIEQSPIAIMIVDSEFIIEYINPKFSELTGYFFDELKGKKLNYINSQIDFENAQFLDELNNLKLWKKELINTKKDGSEFWVCETISPIKNIFDATTHYLVIKEDITERIESERKIFRLIEELQDSNKTIEENYFKINELNEELIELNKTKDKYFSIIAHDLKGPFVTLLNISEHLFSNYEKIDDSLKLELIKNIKDASKSTYNLLSNLLLWAKSQMGAVSFELEEINFNNLVEEVTSNLSYQLNDKKINLINNIQSNSIVKCDKNMISTVFRNLISNAIKFSYENSKIEIYNVIENGKVIVNIEDNGIGMDNDKLDNLFKLGNNKSEKGTKGEKGTGLGLILCKEFIDKHNGEIWVRSKLGEGTIFSFSLPII